MTAWLVMNSATCMLRKELFKNIFSGPYNIIVMQKARKRLIKDLKGAIPCLIKVEGKLIAM